MIFPFSGGNLVLPRLHKNKITRDNFFYGRTIYKNNLFILAQLGGPTKSQKTRDNFLLRKDKLYFFLHPKTITKRGGRTSTNTKYKG